MGRGNVRPFRPHAPGSGGRSGRGHFWRSEEHTSELQSQSNLVCRLLLEKKKIYAKFLKGLGERCTASVSRLKTVVPCGNSSRNYIFCPTSTEAPSLSGGFTSHHFTAISS